MECIICKNKMVYFFTKHFPDCYLKLAEYWKCSICGFVASKTHRDMPDSDWQELNFKFHIENNRRLDNPYNRNQRYFYQALMLFLLIRHGVIPKGEYLDWGCGVGELSDRLFTLFDIPFSNFDKFISAKRFSMQEYELTPRKYSCVANTGVFEHVRERDTLNEIESYVSPDGCLAIHTLVREEIPNDPDWSYLLPVHCAFHTNNSMKRLMLDWGYACSVYNEQAKMWVLFRKDIKEQAIAINSMLGWNYLHFKDGFMDFWK